jgi:tRNA(Ile)-lysidine synthase
VSGGQDSLALLQLLVDIKHHWDWDLGVIHCNHNWRSDAVANAAHVAAIVRSLNLPYWCETAQTPPSGEAAARIWRYDCFSQLAQTENFSHVVTGHTATDRAETLLYNLIRGSGIDGLQSLRWQRNLTPNLTLVRPLLDWTRQATAAFCQSRDLAVWEDSTNHELYYARNRLRQEVLPYLCDYFNPQAEQHLAQTAELLSADVAYLEAEADRHYAQLISPQGLDRTKLQLLPLALQRRIIRRWLQTHHISPNFERIEAVIGLIPAGNRSQTPTLQAGATVQVQHPWLVLTQATT